VPKIIERIGMVSGFREIRAVSSVMAAMTGSTSDCGALLARERGSL